MSAGTMDRVEGNMDQDPNELREQMMAETPDDIATLYSWANLHGAKYRDFSASRREHRLQVRQALRDMADRQNPDTADRARMQQPLIADSSAVASSQAAATYPHEYEAPVLPPAITPVLPLDNPQDAHQYSPAVEAQQSSSAHAPPRPAWLYAETPQAQIAPRFTPQNPAPAPPPLTHTPDVQPGPRERGVSRWYALKGVFNQQPEAESPLTATRREGRAPVIAFFSLAGGTGKTSLVATLGRAMSSFGERDLLVDTSSYGLLPFYFGSREWRPGSVRTFSPPSGASDAAIHLVTYDGDTYSRESPENWLQEELSRAGYGAQRVLIDVAGVASPLARQALRMADVVIVPVVPDLNSVVSLSSVDNFLRQLTGPDGRPVQAVYLLNQYDVSLPLHNDVRDVLRQQLGDRLLPNVLHRSPAVPEALAEGMTVMDYAPGSPIAEDYQNLAAWLRNLSAPATGSAYRGARWSER